MNEIILKTKLLKHQAVGVEKLKRLKVGALYMEMGTGKTRTALELIKLKLDKGKINHIIWLCPCECKINLQRDIEKHCFCDGVITICGIETLSASIRAVNKLMNLVLEKEVFLVVDESNLVKNPFAIRSQNILRLSELCKYKLILNGTPITRSMGDLFSQWRILDWRILGYKSYYSFCANHLEFDEVYKNKIREVLNSDYITDKIAPYTYQVKKDDCLDLPDKVYSKVYFECTLEQYFHYREILNTFLFVADSYDDGNVPETLIYRTINALQEISSGRRITSSVEEKMMHEPFFNNPEDNPRINCLLNILKKLGDKKVIIWCKFHHEIKDIALVLQKNNYSFEMFYGELNKKGRQQALDNFATKSQILIANKACGAYGLNLQFCCNAIYYDNDYDLATRLQSEDRMHRIGQKNRVSIIDIISDCTVDERIVQSLDKKEKIIDTLKRNIKSKNIKDWLYYDNITSKIRSNDDDKDRS